MKNGWWAQTVTVGYEYAKNRRTLGETESVGFEIGVQRTLPVSQTKAWELVTSPQGMGVWLGEISGLKFEPGEKFETRECTKGEIRTVDKGTKLRLVWQPPFLKKPSTLQIYLLCSRNTPNKTNFRFHQEKLSSSAEREKMRRHWQQVLTKLSKLLNP
ncbi:MAG: hypothetical protein A2Z24_01755 [Candidatus Woykebacteria bacterium RBG_16_44_10]|uniref:Activator of Hsp90 ATPase homologue 1/2-like C-terminal domain-containing protein n=1 Tax=Candidatus Woykebacteria bacterium RBG_16_44_10 TaxID=1802597 RepID=A0A1G1WD00_9BACT|nr:MAG: hypothetical protein A2Z24_01755 [Candidatus Woykebacteria bacterium RBG_16_44_10]